MYVVVYALFFVQFYCFTALLNNNTFVKSMAAYEPAYNGDIYG